MPAVWMRFRSELRARWRATLALSLLVGLAGGAILGAIAAARRTNTAFPRLVQHARAWDVLVNPDLGTSSKLDVNAVRRLPVVSDGGRIDGVYVTPSDMLDPRSSPLSIVTDGRVAYRFGRLKFVHGSMPDPRSADDIAVNTTLARREGLNPGSRLELLAVNLVELNDVTSGRLKPEEIRQRVAQHRFGRRITVRVTGVGVRPDAIVVDQGYDLPEMFFTPAFRARHRDVPSAYFGVAARLRRGARDLPEFERQVQAMVPGEALAFQTLAATSTKVDRAVRPQVGALRVFAFVVAATALLVIGQALARQIHLDAVDHPTLHALGFSRVQLATVATLRAGIVALAGAGLAALIAVSVSPWSPIGPARLAEPHPGIAVDAVVLAFGALVIAAAVTSLAWVLAWRLSRSTIGEADAPAVIRASFSVAAASRAGFPPPAVAGVRMALEPGRGRTAAPARTTIVGVSLAIAMVVAAVTFGASLNHLVRTPRLYGWNWSTHVAVAAGDSQDPRGVALLGDLEPKLGALFDRSRAVSGWSLSSLSQLTLNGRTVPALGIDDRGEVAPTVVNGRLPRDSNEIALGARTMRQLHTKAGSRVTVRDPGGALHTTRIVGRVVLPGLGTYPGADKTALGEGAVVTRSALRSLAPDFARLDYLLTFSAGSRPDSVLREAEGTVAEAGGEDKGTVDIAIDDVQRPSDVLSYGRVRSTPVLLAGVLALLTLATVAHALVTTIRRRHRDFALLKTLGFTQRQVLAAVAWQATTVALVAVAVGVPLGISGGRWAWSVLASDLGTISEPEVPWLALAAVVMIAVLLINALAFLPGRLAARLRPAEALRTE